MEKTKALGLVGFILYSVGFVWQIFELIRNIVTDDESVIWVVYALLAVVVAVMIAYAVLYAVFFLKNKSQSAKKLIIMMAASVIVFACFVWSVILFVTSIPVYSDMNAWSWVHIWLTALFCPLLFMGMGALLIFIMSVITFVKQKKQK